MNSVLLIIGGTLAGVVFIASLAFKNRKRVTYVEPMDWQVDDYSPRQTTIQADFITKRDEA